MIIGDSLLDGLGSTEGQVEKTISQSLDSCLVANNAVAGADLNAIVNSQKSCSHTDHTNECLYSVLNGGVNGGHSGMRALVQRETAAGKKVVTVGYPEGAGPVTGSGYEAMMDHFASLAAADPSNVKFLDSRTIAVLDFHDPNSRSYRAGDNSHPSPSGGTVLGEGIAALIKEFAGVDNSNGGSEGQQTATARQQISSGAEEMAGLGQVGKLVLLALCPILMMWK